MRFCECGCGQETQISKRNGLSNRYLSYHHPRGKPSWNKGRPALNRGIPMTVTQREKCREAALGRKHTAETRAKMRASHARYKAQYPKPATALETDFEHCLQGRGLKYEKQKQIGNMCVDFYLPQQNLVIEVDGC